MAKTLKVGVIGVGGIAKTHFPGWQASPLAEMAAFTDVRPDVLKRVAKEQGVKKTYDKIEDLLADKDIDIIDVCTPNMFHTPLSVAALEAGKHVICEKPLAPKPADIKKMIKARDKAKKLLMTAQHFRFDGRSEASRPRSIAGCSATSTTRAPGGCGAAPPRWAPGSSTRRTAAAARASTSASMCWT